MIRSPNLKRWTPVWFVIGSVVLAGTCSPGARAGLREPTHSNMAVPSCGGIPPAMSNDSAWNAPADSLNILEGQVCREYSGTGIAGVQILAEAGQRTYRTATDSTGRYSLVGLPQGHYRVNARMIGYYLEERSITFGECGLLVLPEESTSAVLQGFNPGTCRKRQWLAFRLRERSVY